MATRDSQPTPRLSELKGRRLGRILTKMGKVTREQVHEALSQQSQVRSPLGGILVELGYANEDDVNIALAAQVGVETVDLDQVELSESIGAMLPSETAQSYGALPILFDSDSKTLTVVFKSADNLQTIDDLKMLTGYQIKALMGEASKVEQCMDRLYGAAEDNESLTNLIDEMTEDEQLEDLKDRGESIDLEDLIEASGDNKVVRLLNLVLMQAIKDRSSDIHFEPFEDEFKMRYRIDGRLYEMIPPPRHLGLPIVSRIKVMANLDIAERRMPQDGRIELTVGGKPIDLRVAVLPTMFGESVVMRILDRSNVSLDLAKIGLQPDDLSVTRQLIHKPNGIVIVTGPTGSGKTTTLYSALSELNSVDVKICTAEDPVEYDIDGLVQVQVNPEIGLTFARSLRSFLRQDPDIILVGETRDLETAQIAVQASLTGHLVFTTLHTNDAPSTIARLVDLGLETFLLTATLEGIVGQRLVKRICDRCKTEYEPTEEELMELELTPQDIAGRKLFHGQHCADCKDSGYRGRVGLFEIMVLSDDMRELIMGNASTQVLRTEARKNGMRTMRETGLQAIYDGITTIDEVVRETMFES